MSECARCIEGTDQLMTNIFRQSFTLSLRVLENYKDGKSYSGNERPFSFLHWANWLKQEFEILKNPLILLKTSRWRWTVESLCRSEQHGQECCVPGAASADMEPTVWGNTLKGRYKQAGESPEGSSRLSKRLSKQDLHRKVKRARAIKIYLL